MLIQGGKVLCVDRMDSTSSPGTVFGVGILSKEKQDRFGGKDWCGSALPLPPLTLLSQQLCQPWERFQSQRLALFTCKGRPLAASPGISFPEIKYSREGMWPDRDNNGGMLVGWGDEPVITFVTMASPVLLPTFLLPPIQDSPNTRSVLDTG